MSTVWYLVYCLVRRLLSGTSSTVWYGVYCLVPRLLSGTAYRRAGVGAPHPAVLLVVTTAVHWPDTRCHKNTSFLCSGCVFKPRMQQNSFTAELPSRSVAGCYKHKSENPLFGTWAKNGDHWIFNGN